MIHYVDSMEDYEQTMEGEIYDYALQLREQGVIRSIGMSSHNPQVALRAVESGKIDVLMFSINPAYDMEQADTDIMDLIDFKDLQHDQWTVDPARQKLYAACENLGVGITVMKPLAAGSLLTAEASPFGVAMTVPQCCHYCLTRPGVTSVLVGASSAAQLRENVACLAAAPLSQEEREAAAALLG